MGALHAWMTSDDDPDKGTDSVFLQRQTDVN